MGDLLRCNICFRQPSRETSRFAITNCGHVFCERCLQKGKNEECSVCKCPCRTIFLSNETDPDIKMLFMDINVLCQKFSQEFIQVVEFQGSHMHRLLAHYKRKIAKLENTIKELTQQLQSLRASQSHSRLPTSNMLRNMGPVHSEDRYSPNVLKVPSTKKVEVMDFTSNASRKNSLTIAGPTRLSLISSPPNRLMGHSEDRYSPNVSNVPSTKKAELTNVTSNASRKNSVTIAGPTRLSLISPPPNGIMGSYRSNTTGGPVRSGVGSSQHSVFHQLSQPVSANNHGGVWHLSSQRSPQNLSQTPLPSQTSSARQPITLANILQRRH